MKATSASLLLAYAVDADPVLNEHTASNRLPDWVAQLPLVGHALAEWWNAESTPVTSGGKPDGGATARELDRLFIVDPANIRDVRGGEISISPPIGPPRPAAPAAPINSSPAPTPAPPISPSPASTPAPPPQVLWLGSPAMRGLDTLPTPALRTSPALPDVPGLRLFPRSSGPSVASSLLPGQPSWPQATGAASPFLTGSLLNRPFNPTGPLKLPSAPGSPARVPGFGPDSFRNPFIEPSRLPSAELPGAPTSPVGEPVPVEAPGIGLDIVGDILGGGLIILIAGMTVSGHATLKPSRNPTPQDLVNEGWQYHHWFPQQFEDEFADIGIDVHQYTTLLPQDLHSKLHRLGIDGQKWNEAWDEWLFLAEIYGYGANEAVDFLYEMLEPYIPDLGQIGITGPNGLRG